MILNLVLRILNPMLLHLGLIFFLRFLVVHVDDESLKLLHLQKLFLLLLVLLDLLRLLPDVSEVFVDAPASSVKIWRGRTVLRILGRLILRDAS